MRIVSLHVACFLVTMALVPLREPGIDGRALRMCVGRRAQWDRGVQALLHFAGLAQALAQPSLLDAVNGVFCQLGSKKLSRFKDAAVEGPCSLDQPPTFPANRSYNPRACT